ncbi:hypothetical protein IF1G_00258 [Cordyceps javanica]|uniref:Uncharacterized protein n=1 Tax=Cordyceps javanica TaxID=43265 RepID=A0A545VF23_9HYPO|nr:hypothetical protein IF1G_00258 [Cordyceps javanica]
MSENTGYAANPKHHAFTSGRDDSRCPGRHQAAAAAAAALQWSAKTFTHAVSGLFGGPTDLICWLAEMNLGWFGLGSWTLSIDCFLPQAMPPRAMEKRVARA